MEGDPFPVEAREQLGNRPREALPMPLPSPPPYIHLSAAHVVALLGTVEGLTPRRIGTETVYRAAEVLAVLETVTPTR